MKSLFTLAVLAASTYLAYTQIPAIQDWVDGHFGQADRARVEALADEVKQSFSERIDAVSKQWQSQSADIDALEQQVAALKGRIEQLEEGTQRTTSTQPETIAAEPEATAEASQGASSRSEALAELAERMELKAVGF